MPGSGGQATDPARAIHRLALWVGGLSTAGVMDRLKWVPPNFTGPECGCASATLDTKQRKTANERHRQAYPNCVAPGQLERFQLSRSTAVGHIPCRGSSNPPKGPEPARSRAGNCQRRGRWALSPVDLQHPHLEYEAALTTSQAPTSRRPGRCETLSGRLPLKTRVAQGRE